jgi:hypothetical protein
MVTVVLVAAAGVACRKEGQTNIEMLPVPEARDDNGWPYYEIKREGFALSLPPDWRQFDMSSENVESMLGEMLAKNPELSTMLTGLRQQIASGVKFYGFDPADARTGFGTNVNVLHMPLPPGHDLDTLVAESIQQIKSLSTIVKPVASERIVVRGQERERIRYRMSMRGPNGRNNLLAFTQYVAIDDSSYYVLTLTTMPDREAKYASTFDQIGRSFRLIDR